MAYIADFTVEEKEEFEEVCKVVCRCHLYVHNMAEAEDCARGVQVCFCKFARGNGKAGVAQNAPLSTSSMTSVSTEPRSGDMGKGSDNGPIAYVKA